MSTSPPPSDALRVSALRFSSRSEQDFFARVLSAEQSGVFSPARQYKTLYSAQESVDDTLLLNSQPLAEDAGFLIGVTEGYQPHSLVNQGHRRLSEQVEGALPLPPPRKLSKSLGSCLFQRRSRRSFAQGKMLDLSSFSALLYYSAGCSSVGQQQLNWQNQPLPLEERFHTYPSGGALYPLQLYLGLPQDDVVSAGWYRYQPLSHSLLGVAGWPQDFPFADEGFQAERSRLLLIFVYQVWRNRRKYGRAATSFALMEMGAMVQNFYLTCEALGWACCSWGAFPRFFCERVLQLDGISEQALHGVCIGRRP